VSENADQPIELQPFDKTDPRTSQKDKIDLSNAREITPFKIINRGEDTLSGTNVVFSDFSPKVLPADAPDEVEEIPVPKEESAPEPAPSSESTETPVQEKSEKPAQAPVNKEDGKSEAGSPTSSSSQKSG
jgi:hypothetical protein